MKLQSAEETLNSKLTYGKDTYLAGQGDSIIEAMLEHSRQAVKYALELQAGKATIQYEPCPCEDECNSFNPVVDQSSITDFDYSQIK